MVKSVTGSLFAVALALAVTGCGKEEKPQTTQGPELLPMPRVIEERDGAPEVLPAPREVIPAANVAPAPEAAPAPMMPPAIEAVPVMPHEQVIEALYRVTTPYRIAAVELAAKVVANFDREKVRTSAAYARETLTAVLKSLADNQIRPELLPAPKEAEEIPAPREVEELPAPNETK